MDWQEKYDSFRSQGAPPRKLYRCGLMGGLITFTITETKALSSLFTVSVEGRPRLRTLKTNYTSVEAAKEAAEAFGNRLLGELTDDMKKPDTTAPKPIEPPGQ